MRTAPRQTPLASATTTSHHHHHHHHNHNHNHTSAKSSTTPMAVSACTPASLGPSLPAVRSDLRSPALLTDVRTPSPNYFGLAIEPATDPRDTCGVPRDNWSPPTSSIRSFAAASPMHMPVDSNPEFEAFRRQTQANKGFSLGHGNLSHFSTTPGTASPQLKLPPTSRVQDTGIGASSPRPITGAYAGVDGSAKKADAGTPSFFDLPRQQSPANISTMAGPPAANSHLMSRVGDRHPRLSLPAPSPKLNKASEMQHQRADTLPSSLDESPEMIAPAKLKEMMASIPADKLLLLDLRVFPQFSVSRIRDALNLCIPTTLLKRPSFTLQKLQDTFTNEQEKQRFAKWRMCQYIVVYDAASSHKKDAVSSLNTLKKFTNDGWQGTCYVLKGGFHQFSQSFPDLVDGRSSAEMQSSKKNLSLDASMPDVAPVAGGCMMPATKNAANPFFNNIRQNMDLVGGVGQMDLKRPLGVDMDADNSVPSWLKCAMSADDHGKAVSDKFLHIELDEQARMQQALSGQVSYGTPSAAPLKTVQIAGVEKGSKNRYNNIWPFEHARVRLQGRPDGACDYVNASHIKSPWSNKRYIASQGPLPATYEVSLPARACPLSIH